MFRRLDLSMFFSQITLTITVGAPPPSPLHEGACVPPLPPYSPPSLSLIIIIAKQ